MSARCPAVRKLSANCPPTVPLLGGTQSSRKESIYKLLLQLLSWRTLGGQLRTGADRCRQDWIWVFLSWQTMKELLPDLSVPVHTCPQLADRCGQVRTGADRCGQVRTGVDRCGQIWFPVGLVWVLDVLYVGQLADRCLERTSADKSGSLHVWFGS